MTKNDFYKIIFESFDHLDTPETYFNEKRGICKPSEYATGLRKYFDLINKEVNRTDYSRAERINPDGKYEIYMYEFGETIENKKFEELTKKGELSFPFKKIMNLVKFKTGRLSLIDAFPIITTPHEVVAQFDSVNIEHLEPLLNAYLQYIEPAVEPPHEKSQPIPPEYLESYTEQLKRMGEEMFLSLKEEYKKKWNSRFFAYEIDLVNSQIRLTDEHITEIENLQHQRFKEINGNIQDLKRLPDDYYLPGYKDYLEWLKKRKTELETPNSSPQQKINIPPLKDNTELKQKAEKILIALSGNWINGNKIVTDSDYVKIVEGVNYLIDNADVKPIDSKIKASTTMKFIRRLFRELNTELYGKGIKDCFIDFLHDYFECFDKTEKSNTKSHFNEYSNGNFEADNKKVLVSIK